MQSATTDQSQVASVAFSPSGLLASGSGGNLKVWSVPDLAFTLLSDYPWNEIRSVAISPDGQFLAAGMAGNDNAVKVYGADGTFRLLPFSSWVTVIAFSPDSRFLAVANVTAIQIYRTSDRRPTRSESLGELLTLDTRGSSAANFGTRLSSVGLRVPERRSIL